MGDILISSKITSIECDIQSYLIKNLNFIFDYVKKVFVLSLGGLTYFILKVIECNRTPLNKMTHIL